MKQEIKEFVDKLSKEEALDVWQYIQRNKIGKNDSVYYDRITQMAKEEFARNQTCYDIDIYLANLEGFTQQVLDVDYVDKLKLWNVEVDVFDAVPAHVVQVLGVPTFLRYGTSFEGCCGLYKFVENSTGIPIILVDNSWVVDGDEDTPDELWASTEPMALEIHSDEDGGEKCAARFKAALKTLIKKHKSTPLWL